MRWLKGRHLAVGLALPFLVIALTRGGWAAVFLACAVPVAAGLGILGGRGEAGADQASAAGEALADTLLEHTARGERARIARELHDVVAHHISMIAVQAETARLTTPGCRRRARGGSTEIGDTARAGLTEMRRLLGVLREDARSAGGGCADADREGPSRQPQPGLAQLTELVDDGAGRVARGDPADHRRPGHAARPGGRARRLPHRAGGAHQRPAARARGGG